MPYFNLGISSSTHNGQLGSILKSIEEVLLEEKPERVVIYGNTNSSLAGALVSARLRFL